MFILAPESPAPIDEVIVVEIKRGYYQNGKVHRVDDNEIHKFHNYVLAAKEYYDKNSNPPRVRGLMIAQDYTRRANLVRKSLEQTANPKLEFKTWDSVVSETERMHLGWLEVSRRRVQQGDD